MYRPVIMRTWLLGHATKFVFPDKETRDAVYVEYRGTALWAVTNGFSEVYNNQGEWEHEPMPSGRSQVFIDRTRYSFDKAVEIARKLTDAS